MVPGSVLASEGVLDTVLGSAIVVHTGRRRTLVHTVAFNVSVNRATTVFYVT